MRRSAESRLDLSQQLPTAWQLFRLWPLPNDGERCPVMAPAGQLPTQTFLLRRPFPGRL